MNKEDSDEVICVIVDMSGRDPEGSGGTFDSQRQQC